ncbi:hypothetical protein D9M68_691780 [compost metagenome]
MVSNRYTELVLVLVVCTFGDLVMVPTHGSFGFGLYKLVQSKLATSAGVQGPEPRTPTTYGVLVVSSRLNSKPNSALCLKLPVWNSAVRSVWLVSVSVAESRLLVLRQTKPFGTLPRLSSGLVTM